MLYHNPFSLTRTLANRFFFSFGCRSEKVWKGLGKEGLAVKAPWPIAGEEDKMLTRQAKFLSDALKRLRAQEGKAKKGSTKASILIIDSYPEVKTKALLWMQEQYNAESGFPSTMMKDLKAWTAQNVPDKKEIKFIMQFVSFVKGEVEDVGPSAMDTTLPFDQKEVLADSLAYLKKQLMKDEIDLVKLGEDDAAAADVPGKIIENVTPGKPYLYMR